jgi:hypothetical protein
MTTPASNYYEAISHLSDGASKTFHNVTWDEYEKLVDQIGGTRPGLRISYNDGIEHQSPATHKHLLLRLGHNAESGKGHRDG